MRRGLYLLVGHFSRTVLKNFWKVDGFKESLGVTKTVRVWILLKFIIEFSDLQQVMPHYVIRVSHRVLPETVRIQK